MSFFKYLLFVVVVLISGCQEETKNNPGRQIISPKGMISSAHPLATRAGLEILQSGGNAFDAAVAVAAALNVVEPMMSGMGGYGTILIYDAKKKQIRFLDSSGKIPLKMDSDLMRPPTPGYLINRFGAKSISTPGAVNAWDALSGTYGRKEWAALFQPAIQLAEEGFLLSERFAKLLAFAYKNFPAHAQEIYGKNGAPLAKGDKLIQRDLANSLRKVAESGRSVFYEGELAKTIHTTMEAQGSFLAIDDLQNDEAEWWEPIKIDYKGYEVYTASPPANSFPALIRLGLMRQFEDRGWKHNDVDYLHHFAEVTKHAFWCRLRYAGDPEISPPPLDMLLSEEYLQETAADISSDKAKDFKSPAYVSPIGKNTTHFVVADQWGNIVSATQTLGNLFGSKIMPEGTGIWMNNSLAYCTYEPKGNPMDAIPGQRKLSGDCPVIILKDQQPWAALGTPGGHTIPQTVPQMILNLIDFNMDIAQALAAPRISFIEPNALAVESSISKSVQEKLKAKGHQIRPAQTLGNAHGLSLHYDENGAFLGYKGAADPRGEGRAEGY